MDTIYQGELEVIEQIKPPQAVVRGQYTCPYCHRANFVHFLESQVDKTINSTCRECEAVWAVRLKENRNE